MSFPRLTRDQLAPQRLRDTFRKLGYELSAERENPRRLLQRIGSLLKLAKKYVWDTSRGRANYEDAVKSFESYREAVRKGQQPYMRGLAYALSRIIFAPAFKRGDETARGTIEGLDHAMVDESRSDGWLYRVRNPRGALESLWESTLVHPMQQGRDAGGYAAAKRHARGIEAMMKRYGGGQRSPFGSRDRRRYARRR